MAKAILPESITDETTTALADLMDGPGTLDYTPLLVTDYDNCPAEYLPLHIERFALQGFVLPGMPEQAIRNLLKNARELHMYSGTRYGVRRSLESLGINGQITEWFEETPQAEPYTFKVKAFVNSNIGESDVVLSAERQQWAMQLVNAVNRASVTFELTLGVETNAAFKTNGAVRAFQTFSMHGDL